ncbi:RNA polymerase sigma factor SigM [Mycolicibacterium frederiksbergense]|uniref:RNA polymerase sigma factor SigM n=1 Tax=Mycolicibacterium frederiksbergense TaxID=117567 RepID=A0A6H0S4C3_9MYCO|nr:RNA polymerase sigma factor SigM [Mycolicibacterium frederiksbergense]QIV82000.1 RNA polymerase sigma factor SigM [Mycolicibacterium frederiksbergense]
MGSFGGRSGHDRTDEQLLAAHVAGDRFAFEELFNRYQPQLYQLARITIRCPDDARDALQDAMLSAHCGAPKFRHDCSVSSWLYRIVVNACLDRLRRHKARPTTPLEVMTSAGSVGDPAPGVDTAIVVELALMRLPVEQRAAIVAVDMQGFSVAEAARMLGVPEGTVKSRRARARTKLATTLGHLCAPVAAAESSVAAR